MKKVRRVNPIAKALLSREGRKPSVVKSKKTYDRSKNRTVDD